MAKNWHAKTTKKNLQELKSDEHGLTNKKASELLKKYGPNKLLEGKAASYFAIFLRQFQSPLIYILIISSIIILITGKTVDSVVIFAILIFNAIVGAIQEGKAQNTLRALNKFVKTESTVLREGRELIVPDTEIVPGDIIILQEGEKVPVDARIILSKNLIINEAELTGESKPKHKLHDIMIEKNASATEQRNMVFKGTYVISGNGEAIAVATGINTIIGKISKKIAEIDTEIPLKANIRNLSRLIIAFVIIFGFLLFFTGIFLGKSVPEMFAIIVALSVSIIPEGLPIVMTIALASGVWRMSKQNALIKKLHAVEALGETKIIAVDKTGTITKNEMMVQKVFVNNKYFDIEGVGYEPKCTIKLNKNVVGAIDYPDLLMMGKIATFSSNAHVMFSKAEGKWHVSGDPTEAAMIVFGSKLGFYKDDLEKNNPRLDEIPFDYKRKYHAVLHRHNDKRILAIAGAPEEILLLSEKIYCNEKSYSIDEKERLRLESIFTSMSQDGLRVVALAYIETPPKYITPKTIKSLTFAGFLGIKDTLRTEVKDSLQKTTEAGIRVVMITGDHELTAKSIAKEAGIYKDGDLILTGKDIDNFSEDELFDKINKASVFARVTPEHKLKIVNAYKSNGQIIAMTGDGVNDAPSLVAANLGVAMGKIGTEVAKEASDIVLLDDDFGSIVSAVEEGRNIYKTIKKVILYLFSANVGEILTIITAILLHYPLPILPAQIIWLNFVTDGFLDVALIMDPKEENLLSGSFGWPQKYLVDKAMAKRMLLMAIPMAAGTLFLFKQHIADDLTKAWTMSLTTLAVFQWFNAWNCRHESKSIFQINPLSNMFLVTATIIVVFLQLLIIYNPLMQNLFHTTALNLLEWRDIILVSTSIIIVEEIRKFFLRRKET